MDTTEASAIDRAAELGTEHGTNAARWLFDGSTDAGTYLRVLVGIEEGDPEVLDTLPTAELSGEWADGLLPSDLFQYCTGLDAHAQATFNQEAYWCVLEELCDAYVAPFSDAVTSEVERIAREYVENDSTPLGRLLTAIRTHAGMSYSEVCQGGEHGADAGWPGFTYYANTVEFYDANSSDVWELVTAQADDMGVSPLALVASFNSADSVEDAASFGNLLAWFALEEVGRYLSDAA